MTKKIWASLDPFIEGGAILGRKVANASFLKALLSANPYDAYHFFLQSQEQIASVQAWVRANFPELHAQNAFSFFLHTQLHKEIARTSYHCFHLSDFLTHQIPLVRLRNAFAKNLFPITGLTHSLSYQRYMPKFLEHLWSASLLQDVIIATSKSAEFVLHRVFEHLQNQYNQDFAKPNIQLIPLGVNTEDFPEPEERWDAQSDKDLKNAAKNFRAKLGLDNKVVFLCLARISPYSKMDFNPIFAAFKRAEKLGLAPNSYALVLAGWLETNSNLPNALEDYAKSQGIDLVTIASPSDAERKILYAAADIFISPADNFQETFGLTIVEAGLASLPTIASDFDGYKDTIINQQTGFLIPCLGLASTRQSNLLAGLWFDNQYHLKLAQSVAINIPDFADKIARLGSNINLRRTMGKNARAHCLQHFTWEEIIPQYVALWDRLASEEISQGQIASVKRSRHPLEMDFGKIFAKHCTATLTSDLVAELSLRITPRGEAVYRKALPAFFYAGVEEFIDAEELHQLLLICRKSTLIQDIFKKLTVYKGLHQDLLQNSFEYEQLASLVLWALKQDYLEISSGEQVISSQGNLSQSSTNFNSPQNNITKQALIQTHQLAFIGKQSMEVLHDINNPLAIIQSTAELILENMEDDPQDTTLITQNLKAAQNIGKQVNRIKAIAEKMRGFDKVEAVQLHSTIISKNIEESILFLQSKCQEKDIKLTIELATNVDEINIPHNLLRQVLINILDNAIEASPVKGIILIKSWQQNNTTCISILDQGGGIEPLIFKQLFTPIANHKKIWSLGLYNCKILLASFAAKIDATTSQNGTKFTLSIPK